MTRRRGREKQATARKCGHHRREPRGLPDDHRTSTLLRTGMFTNLFCITEKKKLDNSLTFLILFEDIRPDGYLASQYLEHPYNSTSNHESHHGCSESQGLELFHILLPVLRTIVRYIEDLFAQFSKPAIFFKKLMLNK